MKKEKRLERAVIGILLLAAAGVITLKFGSGIGIGFSAVVTPLIQALGVWLLQAAIPLT